MSKDWVYVERFFQPTEAMRFFNALRSELNWKQESITLFGKTFPEPRLTAWYAQNGETYSYSNKQNIPEPFTPVLSELLHAVSSFTGDSFNSVLANLYRNGNDRMGWHSDDEPELGLNPSIVSLSFGAERDFLFRPAKGGQAQSVLLGTGSLFWMRNQFQSIYKHALPARKRILEERINLTFRNILPVQRNGR